MPEELQGLLNRIHKEGIKKAETEKDELIANAKKEADDIVKKATQDAKNIIKRAEEKAVKEEQKSKASIQQAARDILITLRAELTERIQLCVKDLASEAMTPTLMSETISKMADAFAKSSAKKQNSV